MQRKFGLALGLLISILTSNMVYSQSENDCKALHNGKFTYGNPDNLIEVEITGKKHTEYYNSGKYYIKSKLSWLSDCEYNMTMIKVTIPDFQYGKGDIMNVKIDKVEGNKIYYTSTVKGQSWKGVFTKIE